LAENVSQPYDIEVFFDGGCPLCRREIRLLQRRDRHRRIRFTDLDAPDFRPADVGMTRDALMAQMHGRLSDGTWLTGVEVFRRMYAVIGFGLLVRLSRLPLISHALELGYWAFARNRLRLTSRCTAVACPAAALGRLDGSAEGN
jgi:predicted DCC family thiol-disulfide oxidoreductase YuxK